MIVFGPVPSRRLGRSLGINNIPPKNCSFNCIYCQAGKTKNFSVTRQEYYSPADIFREVILKIRQTRKQKERIDYISFVPDGEPTLDINLGKTIELLKLLGLPIAVFTNSSLIYHDDVVYDLIKADLVSVKVDTNDINIWNQINRSHKTVDWKKMMDGIITFRQWFRGSLITETMLVGGINDSPQQIESLAQFISGVQPDMAYLSIPTRPPAENGVTQPSEEVIQYAYQAFRENIDHVKCLTEQESDKFTYSGDIENDILSITSVHPMRKQAVIELLNKAHEGWDIIDQLIARKKLVETTYRKEKYYQRKF